MPKDYHAIYKDSINEHREWLSSKPLLLKQWNERLKNQPQSALCEALLRKILKKNVDSIEVEEQPDKGGIDFKCKKNNTCFYVECCCLEEETVEKKTSLPKETTFKATHYSLLTEEFKNKCINKGKQLSKYPQTVRFHAIATLHSSASVLCFMKDRIENILTSDPKISFQFDVKKGRAVGPLYETTDIRKSSFLKPSEIEIKHARQYISALLTCGFGINPPNVYGVIHPDAAMSFDRRLIPNIEFSRLKEGYENGVLEPEWI